MGQDVKNRSRICPLPPGPLMEVSKHLKPRTIIAVSLTFILTTAGLVWILTPPLIIPIIHIPPPPPPSTGVITIDGDANFTATALLEGWPGDGSPENPIIIDGLDIGLSNGANHCIMISNTQVSFSINNCNFYGFDGGAGIHLRNVTNGEMVKNNCNSNYYGIKLEQSDHNTMENNTCNDNTRCGIWISESDFNTVANNTCNDNGRGILLHRSNSNTAVNNTSNGNRYGISISTSHSNTVANNTCSNNIDYGISLIYDSESNIVANNTCNSNDNGIFIRESSYNIAVTNTCKDNRIGIYLTYGCLASNIIADNTFSGNTEHDIFEDSEQGELYPVILLPIGLAGIIMLGAAWRMLSGIRESN